MHAQVTLSAAQLNYQISRGALCYIWYMAVRQEPPKLGRKLFKASVLTLYGVGPQCTQEAVGKNPDANRVAQMWLRGKDGEAQQLYRLLGFSTPKLFAQNVNRYMAKAGAAAPEALQPLPVRSALLCCCYPTGSEHLFGAVLLAGGGCCCSCWACCCRGAATGMECCCIFR
jgi:hypothetical protein